MGCLFCDIIGGTIPSSKVYENNSVFAFDDISPQSPVHVLLVPKLHVENIDAMDENAARCMSDIFLAVKEVARIKGLANGYRVIINNGPAGGQVIWHLHVHVLGGKDDMGPMLAF